MAAGGHFEIRAEAAGQLPRSDPATAPGAERAQGRLHGDLISRGQVENKNKNKMPAVSQPSNNRPTQVRARDNRGLVLPGTARSFRI